MRSFRWGRPHEHAPTAPSVPRPAVRRGHLSPELAGSRAQCRQVAGECSPPLALRTEGYARAGAEGLPGAEEELPGQDDIPVGGAASPGEPRAWSRRPLLLRP